MKTCYYEVLGVERDCDDKTLKKAYFKMSLKFHPDKNKEDDAREKFQSINEAYECLSDPNERTWYDNHRTQILSGKNDQNSEDLLEASFGGLDPNKYMSRDCFDIFNDGKKGFYAVYRTFFEKIKSQESKAFEQGDQDNNFFQFPGFGDSKTDPIIVNEFYVKWDSFVTYKNFSWADQYREDDASRYVQRIIERENNKFRKKEKKTYIDTIKKIVDICQKKDPRYQEFLKIEEEERLRKKKYREQQALEKERQKKELRKQQREIEQKRLLEEEELIQKGLKVVEGYDQFDHIQQEEELKDYYCQVCDKEYKNENALENHMKSKQHKKNTKLLLEQVGTTDEIKLAEQQDQQKNKNAKTQKKSFDEQEIIQQEQELEQLQQKKNKKNKKKNKLFQQQFQQSDNQFEQNPEIEQVDFDIIQPKEKSGIIQEKKEEETTIQRKKSSVDQESDEDENFMQFMNKNIQKKNQQTKQKSQKNNKQIIEEKQNIDEKKEEKQNTDEKKESELNENQINKDEKKEQDENQTKQANDKPNNKTKQNKQQSKVEQAQHEQININELSKAKQKKLKKKLQEQNDTLPFKCNVCKAGFPSKTKMFDHCKKEGHLKAV